MGANEAQIYNWLMRAITGNKLIVDLPGGKSVTISVTHVSTERMERITMDPKTPTTDDFPAFMKSIGVE